MTNLRIIAASLFAAAAIASIAPAAFAEPATNDAPTLAVDYSDLKLDTDQGRATLQRRISRAADEVCSADLDNPDRTQGQADFSRCRQQAVTQATTQIAAKLTNEHLAIH